MRIADDTNPISMDELRLLAEHRFGDMVKAFADFFEGPNQYGSTGHSLQKYFDAYAVAARRARET